MQINTEMQTWKYKGTNFTVEVVRWADASSKLARNILPDELKDTIPENHWNVYAIIFQKHPLFDKIINDSLFDYGIDLPLHWGASYHNWNYDSNGAVGYKKIGSDYQHIHDEKFGNYKTVEEACEILNDAKELFEYLKNKDARAEQQGSECEQPTTAPCQNALENGASA